MTHLEVVSCDRANLDLRFTFDSATSLQIVLLHKNFKLVSPSSHILFIGTDPDQYLSLW